MARKYDCYSFRSHGAAVGDTPIFHFPWLGYLVSRTVTGGHCVASCMRSQSLSSYVTDGTVAILIGSLPLVLPDRNPFTGKIRSFLERHSPSHVYFSQLEVQAYRSVGSFVDRFPLGCLHVARCRHGHC